MTISKILSAKEYRSNLLLGVIILASTFVVSQIVKSSLEIGIFIVGGLLMFCLVLLCIKDYKFGFYASSALGFIIFSSSRLFAEHIPWALIVEIPVFASFLGLLIAKALNGNKMMDGAKHVITYVLLGEILFFILELLNPAMYSPLGWLNEIRRILLLFVYYFLALNVLQTLRDITRFTSFLLGLLFVSALYGCWQHWVGFMGFELEYVLGNERLTNLYFMLDGFQRKFSLFSDPAAFGITMAASATFIFPLIMGTGTLKKKATWGIMAIFMVLGMVFSGTRTAYFILTAGVFLFLLMTINRKSTLYFAVACAFMFAFIMLVPIYSNPTLNRFRSTFYFSDDSSMKVRDVNRKMIQPYVYAHPFGGGMGTSGGRGLEFNPGHVLAGFPPDSGYVKSFIETGWIGFLVKCLVYFIILQSAVKAYFLTHNRLMRNYLLSATLCVFAFAVAQYGQEAVGQIPDSFLFLFMPGNHHTY